MQSLQKYCFDKCINAVGNLIGRLNELFVNILLMIGLESYQRKIDSDYDTKTQNPPESLKGSLIARDNEVELGIRRGIQSANTMVYVGGAMHFFGNYDNIICMTD